VKPVIIIVITVVGMIGLLALGFSSQSEPTGYSFTGYVDSEPAKIVVTTPDPQTIVERVYVPTSASDKSEMETYWDRVKFSQENSLAELLTKSKELETNTKSEVGFSSLVCKKKDSGSVILTGKYTSDQNYEIISLKFWILNAKGDILDYGLGHITNINVGETKNFSLDSVYRGNYYSCQVEFVAGY